MDGKKYYEKNRERLLTNVDNFRYNNPDKVKEYYVKNKEKIKKRNKINYYDKKEKIIKRNLEYYHDNKEVINEKRRERRKNNKKKHVLVSLIGLLILKNI